MLMFTLILALIVPTLFVLVQDGRVVMLRKPLVGGECVSVLVYFHLPLILFLNGLH